MLVCASYLYLKENTHTQTKSHFSFVFLKSLNLQVFLNFDREYLKFIYRGDGADNEIIAREVGGIFFRRLFV